MHEEDVRFQNGSPTFDSLTTDMVRSLDVELCPGRIQEFLHEMLLSYIRSDSVEGLNMKDLEEITYIYSVLRDYFNHLDKYVFSQYKEVGKKKVA